jgi:hypothetical protein
MSQNQHFEAPLNKSERDAIAKEAIASLQKTLATINTYFDAFEDVFYTGKFVINLPAEAPASITFYSVKNAPKEASNHARLKALAMTTAAKQNFSGAERAFRRLFPGQAFHIMLDNRDRDKVCLRLGEGDIIDLNPQGSVIRTVLSRWKSQLIRLSCFFSAANDYGDNEDIQRFVFFKNIKCSEPGNVDNILSHVADARSLTQAVHFSSFSSSSGAAPQPETFSPRFAGKLTTGLTREDFEKKFQNQALIKKSNQQDWILEQTKKSSSLLKKILEDAHPLSHIGTVKISCNILTGKINIKLQETLHAHPDDRRIKDDLIETLRADIEKLSDLLKEDLLEVHPDLHQAYFTKTIMVDRKKTMAQESFNFVLDLLSFTVSSYQNQILDTAIELSQMVEPKNWNNLQRYVSVPPAKDGRNIVYNSMALRYTDATSHAHAAKLFYSYGVAKDVVYHVEPIRREDLTEALCRTADSAFDHFNTLYVIDDSK